MVEEVKNIECKSTTWDELDEMFDELKCKYRIGDGTNLRAELTSTIVGARLVIVFDWDDM